MSPSSESSFSTKRAAGLLFTAAAASFLGPASAFCPLSHSVHQSSTALHLKTGQGNQLAAAYNAANCGKKDRDDDDEYFEVVKQKAETAPADPEARSLAARLFSLDFKRESSAKHDIVYYPLVGFKMVHHEGRVIPLPTSSKAACRIPTRAQADEQVYGWYSPSCSLDLYSEDISHKPTPKPDSQFL